MIEPSGIKRYYNQLWLPYLFQASVEIHTFLYLWYNDQQYITSLGHYHSIIRHRISPQIYFTLSSKTTWLNLLFLNPALTIPIKLRWLWGITGFRGQRTKQAIHGSRKTLRTQYAMFGNFTKNTIGANLGKTTGLNLPLFLHSTPWPSLEDWKGLWI